jgi:hypothetical protein
MAEVAFGMTATVGDTVVYPGRQSSSMWLNKGVIVQDNGKSLKIKREPRWSWGDQEHKIVHVTNLHLVVPISERVTTPAN